MSEQEAGGMFVVGSANRVPLTGVRIEVKGSGAAARVTVTQKYVNTEKVPVEAVYSFPLEEGCAVCDFAVEIGGKRLVGKIEEREKAFEQYDDAMSAGHGAFLADQDRPNIFTVSVGNLLPNQEATVLLTYATELEQHTDTVRIHIPTTISPRYVPAETLKKMDPAERDRINPPTVIGGVPYGLTLKVEYEAPQGVKSVACPSHPAQVEVSGNIARVELMGEKIQLDRDFVLNVTLAKPFEPSVVVTRDGPGERALMVNLFPDLKKFQRGPCEFIFIVDRSGSMEGQSIEQARNALLLAVRSMDEGDSFNVIGFGSDVQLLFKESKSYSQATLEEATQTLAAWRADLGGTELLKPLTLALEKSGGEKPRQVMLLTDGQVGNEAACIEIAGKQAGKVRVFTFGIGQGVSDHLIKGLARASGGQAEFIHPNERIEPKVMRQFARAAAPFLKNVRMDWGGLKTDLVTPEELPPLFDGDRLTVYARVNGGDGREVAVLADGPDGALRFPVAVDLERPSEVAAVPVLLARNAIRELEEGRTRESRGSNQGDRRKKTVDAKVLELALRYQIMSSQTSFVAIEERAANSQTERAQLRRVPIALTANWGAVNDPNGTGTFAALPPGGGYGGGAGMILGAMMPPSPPSPQGVVQRVTRSAPKSASAPSPAKIKAKGESFLGRLFGGKNRKADEGGPTDGYLFLGPDTGVEDETRAEPVPAADLLMLLTAGQKADGSFEFNLKTMEAFQVTAVAVKAAAAKLSGVAQGERIVHTALALALLEKRFGDRRDEWRMLADKAQRWLVKQKVAVPGGGASLVEWARAELKVV